MSMKHYDIGEPLLDLDLELGEGCVWDSIDQVLYFIDIDLGNIYIYDPISDKYGSSHFDKKVTAIALLHDGKSGLIAAMQDVFAYIPEESLPEATFPRSSTTPNSELLADGLSEKRLYRPISLNNGDLKLQRGEARLNEGACDPAGRFLCGTMSSVLGEKEGRMWSLESASSSNDSFDGNIECEAQQVLSEITCTNGMAWFDDGKKMYFTDSVVKEICTFDYDLATGTLSNRSVFSHLPAPEYGYPDGLCLDDQGGVWSARWESGKVVRLRPEDGQVDVEIAIKGAWNVTCCIFGASPVSIGWFKGKDLTNLYITTAARDNGAPPPSDRHLTEKGKLYVIRGLGYRGVERGRFKAHV